MEQDQPPAPWEELFRLLELCVRPAEAANTWFHNARFSCLYSAQPDLGDLLDFLKFPLPDVEAETNKLLMKPRFLSYSQAFQRNLLCFLALNVTEPREDVIQFVDTCITFYRKSSNDTLLYFASCLPGCFQKETDDDIFKPLCDQVLNEVQQCFPNLLVDDDAKSVLSVLGDSWVKHVPGDFPAKVAEIPESISMFCDDKKTDYPNEESVAAVASPSALALKPCVTSSTVCPRVEVDSNCSDMSAGASLNVSVPCAESLTELKSIVSREDCNEFFAFMCSHDEVVIEKCCGFVFGDVDTQSTNILSAAAEMFLSLIDVTHYSGCLKSFLNFACVRYICSIKSSAPRKFIQSLQRLAKKYPDAVTYSCLIPVIENCDVTQKQAAVITNLAKTSLTADFHRILIKTVAKIEPDCIEAVNVAVSLLQSLVDLKPDLEQDCLSSFSKHLYMCSRISSTSFPLTKLILAFAKKYSTNIAPNDVAILMDAVVSNETPLKNACITILSSL